MKTLIGVKEGVKEGTPTHLLTQLKGIEAHRAFATVLLARLDPGMISAKQKPIQLFQSNRGVGGRTVRDATSACPGLCRRGCRESVAQAADVDPTDV